MKPKLSKASADSRSNNSWSIEDIVDGPKYEMVNGRRRRLYKVKWSESYELESNIPSELIEIYKKRGRKEIKILGPLIENRNTVKEGEQDEKQENGITKSTVPLTKARFAVEIGNDVSFMHYKQVKSLYKDELLQYFEDRARIDDE